MHRLFLTLGWTLGALLLATAVSAQSLVEIAAKEKARRKTLEGEKSTSYTEVDLANSEGPLTQVTGSATAEGEASVSEGDDASTAEPAQGESYWRDRLTTIDGKIRDFEEQLQSPLYNSNPRGAIQRQQLERQLEEARQEREALLTEARRARVPPGWLR